PAVNNSGQAVANVQKNTTGIYEGGLAFRWDSTGSMVELDVLGTNARGFGYTTAFAVNEAGQVVGSSTKYVSGVDNGNRAVRWHGQIITELGNLGTNGGLTNAFALAVNNAGQAVGTADNWSTGNSYTRAVRWASDGAANELIMPGAVTSGAYDINNSGQVAGW